jgi:predicted transposase YbfD/YdcC
MSTNPTASLMEHFSGVEDPRSEFGKRHLLLDIIVIAICAVICGADNWVEVELFGRSKEQWLRTFLELPHGIPSHDTFGRVFGLLDATQFRQRFRSWIEAVGTATKGQVVPVDGKTLRRSHDRTLGKAAIQMVSAWATANRLVLGQIKVDDQSNEITAIPDLLEVLDIAGCIVTVDAIGCQRSIAETIVGQKADYVLALKANQGNLYTEVADLFAYAEEIEYRDVEHDFHQTVSKDHGRIEIRQCWTITNPDFLDYVHQLRDWPKLNAIVKVHVERRVGTEVTRKTRYYITSLGNDAQQALYAVRGHWKIENQVHWVLDVVFREDHSRIRKGNGAQNFAILRHIALNLLHQEKTAKVGIKAKRLRAALDEKYMLKVLMG